MAKTKKDPTAALPNILPIFPLTGVILFPGCKLPLNIFEPRYIAMFESALATSHRLIGLVQPKDEEGYDTYQVGCAGRIVAFEETSDGRYLINLLGVSRFQVAEEVDPEHGYRRIRPSWSGFAGDLPLEEGQTKEIPVTGDEIVSALSPMVEAESVQVDWEGLKALPAHQMIDILAMHLPFSTQDKQALLEARDTQERFDTLKAAAQIYAVSNDSDNAVTH